MYIYQSLIRLSNSLGPISYFLLFLAINYNPSIIYLRVVLGLVSSTGSHYFHYYSDFLRKENKHIFNVAHSKLSSV